ncbi:MAG: DNA primase [Rhodospirillales bacterium]|nr:DNA primase [Rhodospirillales bacterium]HJO96805.1 DNA primase [Rhodospirillales bacterium]
MAFTPQFLDELRARVGVADVVGRRVRLTRKGREHLGLCPFHKEKTPSFTVNDEKGFYHCFGCGEHGSAIDFVMKTEGLSFPETVERLAAEAGMEVPVDTPEERERARRQQTLYDVMEAAAAFYARTLRMPEGKAALDYLRGRGLDDQIISRFGLGFAPDVRGALKGALARAGTDEDQLVAAGLMKRPDDGRDPFDYFRRRIMFPITDKRGRTIAFGGRIMGDGEPKYLNSPDTPLFNKGRVLYGVAQAAPSAYKSGEIVVAEGYMDVIALNRAGFEAAVAPLGTALTEDQIVLLWRLAPEPVVCFDGDAAGARAAARAAERVLPLLKPGFSLRFAILPEGEDPDSLIEGAGRDALARTLAAAMPLSDALWRLETGGRSIETPEERAALDDRLKKHALRIADATVRGHFLSAFKDRLWRELRGAGRGQPAKTATGVQAGAHVDSLLLAQRVLIAIVINHLGLFDHFEEDLGSVAYSDGPLDALRQDLISVINEGDGLDSHRVREALRERGHAATLRGLFGDPLISRHRFIGAAAADQVRATWNENYALLCGTAVRAQIEAGKAVGAEGYSDEDWQRQRALIEASLDKPESEEPEALPPRRRKP